MNTLDFKIPPLALLLMSAAIMWAIALAFPDPSFNAKGAGQIAMFLAMVGLGTALLGVMQFRSAGTTVDPRFPDQSASLVVGGVYKLSRNPMYVGFLLVLAGWGVFLGSAIALVILPAFVMYLNRFQILPEERFLSEKFGEEYRQYMRRVHRWI